MCSSDLKRDGAEGLEGYRNQGLDAAAVVGTLAASAGLVEMGARLSAQELVEQLDLETFQSRVRRLVQQTALA